MTTAELLLAINGPDKRTPHGYTYVGRTYHATRGPYLGQTLTVATYGDELFPGEDRYLVGTEDGREFHTRGEQVRAIIDEQEREKA